VTERALDRIGAFSDGVMAVAITLLVLNIQVPTLEHGQTLGDALWDLLPSLGAFALAFGLVGRFWVIHHNLFEKLRGFDQTLMLLNLGFLAAIVLIPFSAELYDTYTDEGLAAAVLGANLGIAAAMHWAMTAHVMRSGLVHEERRDRRTVPESHRPSRRSAMTMSLALRPFRGRGGRAETLVFESGATGRRSAPRCSSRAMRSSGSRPRPEIGPSVAIGTPRSSITTVWP